MDYDLQPVDHQPQFSDVPGVGVVPADYDLQATENIPTFKQAAQAVVGGVKKIAANFGVPSEEIKNAKGDVVFPGNDFERGLKKSDAAATSVAEGVMGPGGPRAPHAVMTKVPDLRGMAVNDAISIARGEPHLIPKEDGGFVGGPPSVKTYADLQLLRQKIDQRIAANPEGGTWYERYRDAVKEVTGNNPIDNDWMTKQHAQWSAGVSPESELQFTLRENNASLAGMPTKSYLPAQHEAHEAALAAKDPNEYQLGQKTAEYARHNNPDQAGPQGATGVNDFRYQKEFGYPKVTGGGLTSSTIHKFMDYETALAVERANKANLGGRSNWTGEQTQASPWVTQKAEALMKKRGIPFEEAYAEANKQIGDFYDKHTAFATHEAQPGEVIASTGHMPGSVKASQAERNAFADDPRSSWDNPETGRDDLYSGLRIPGTGDAMRVRPSVPMQGAYMNQYNKGVTGRPLVAFESGPTKDVAPADRTILNAGETVRAVIDAQDMGGWHKPWMGGRAKDSNSLFIPQEGKLTPEQIPALEAAGAPQGLPHAVDTGRGVSMTNFGGELPKDVGKSLKGGLDQAIEQILGPSKIQRAKISSSDYEKTNLADSWKGQAGGGTAIRQMLDQVTQTPQLREAFNNNEAIPQRALQRLDRDQDWASKWGAPREDLQNARRIIGQGKGWVDRLEAALKAGAILPATAVAVMGTSVLYGHRDRE